MKRMGKMFLLLAAISILSIPVFAQNAPSAPEKASPDTAAPARTITIHAKKFEFVPAEITLRKNQTVKLELTSDDVEHSLVVPGLGIDGKMIKGQVTEAIVTPTKVGDFQGRCGIYCGIGHGKMHFVVHVIN